MLRAENVPPDLPKLALLMLLFPELPGSLKLVWFSVLKVSPRNCILTRSVILMFLNTDMSVSMNRGPTKVLRPKFPGLPADGGLKGPLKGPVVYSTKFAVHPVHLSQPSAHWAWLGLKFEILELGRSFRTASLLKSQNEATAPAAEPLLQNG